MMMMMTMTMKMKMLMMTKDEWMIVPASCRKVLVMDVAAGNGRHGLANAAAAAAVADVAAAAAAANLWCA